MLRYAITDRRLFPGSEADRRRALVAQATRLAGERVEYLQVREKDLSAEDLLSLCLAIREAVAAQGGNTRVLLNGPAHIARAADIGLHLPSSRLQTPARPVSISCHSQGEIKAASGFAEVLLFAPVFEKEVAGEYVQQGRGLDALAEACTASGGVPVFALGGITSENAAACVAAGASGVAGIRMFLRQDIPSEGFVEAMTDCFERAQLP